MKFPSLEFMESLQAALNDSDRFAVVSKWSDVKVLLCFGDQRYWMKLYGGKVIDMMEYFPMVNPLGWDYMIGGSVENWKALRQGSRPLGHLLDTGSLAVDGDLLQANRLYESTHVMLSIIRDLKIAD
jgi:hypothetical protein|tara:strand:+ start:153 stop:533 length:381 start_codon:yes stop_codon:yes gene_type:complete